MQYLLRYQDHNYLVMSPIGIKAVQQGGYFDMQHIFYVKMGKMPTNLDTDCMCDWVYLEIFEINEKSTFVYRTYNTQSTFVYK